MQQERVRGGENLVFASREEAAQFQESLEHRIEKERSQDTSHGREIVAEELAKKFEEHGIGVSSLHVPWEHTQEEHIEVQELVNVAFAEDLRTALIRAEKSDSFPRNIDLFHDVLTGELYDAVVRSRLNVVHASPKMFFVILIPFMLVLVALIVFTYSL